MNGIDLRIEWERLLEYWCKEAEISPKAAEIEAQEARIGFMGERLMVYSKNKYMK